MVYFCTVPYCKSTIAFFSCLIVGPILELKLNRSWQCTVPVQRRHLDYSEQTLHAPAKWKPLWTKYFNYYIKENNQLWKRTKTTSFQNHSFTYNSLNNLLFETIFTIIEVDIGGGAGVDLRKIARSASWLFKNSLFPSPKLPMPFLPKAVDPKKIANPPTIIPYELTPMRLKFDPQLFYLTLLTPRKL